MKLPYDTRVHYILGHVHPYAESLTLRDLTDDKVLFSSEIQLGEQGQIRQVGLFSSEEGLPIYKDHEYDLISVYNNTSQKDQDAMAIVYMYAADHRYRPPAIACGGG